jgi:leucyl aminopeptidase
MKISFNKTTLNTIGKDITPVYLEDGEASRFVELQNGGASLYIGIGKRKEVTRRKFVLLCRKIITLAKMHKLSRIVVQFDKTFFPLLKKVEDGEIASLIAQNFEMANFEFTTFRSKPKEGWPEVREVVICGKTNKTIHDGFKKGQIIGEYVNICRELANTPGGDMTPTILGSAAQKIARGTNVKVKVLGKKELEKLRAGAILGVARGSKEEPKLIVMEYRGGTSEKPIVLVGKGVTFDTGGINLKSGDGSLGMHMDMSGGAAVITAVTAAASLKIRKNIIGIVPAVENMPSGESYRPGDVLKSMSGKTIEVLNTDAEGRVILADALTYARRYNPRLIVDIATLTGAALVALGQRASAIMTKDEKLQNVCMQLGEESGDYLWPFPLWEEYEEEIKGSRGDITNIHNANSRYGGVINGGIFLHEFTRDLPWIHIDIAPRMESIPGDYLAKGAAGEPVRFLLKLVEQY